MRCSSSRVSFRAVCFYLAALILMVTAPSLCVFAQTTPTLTVDASGNPHPINPDIYGMANYGLDPNYAKEIQIPNIRWGGDGTTRYNWEVDSSNAGFDWYFMGGNGNATATPSASADLMINTYTAASKAHTLLTIPIIPYVNKASAWTCSFPVSVYGAQQSTNPYVHPNGDNCGNSIATNGTQLMDTNIYANHIDNTVALQQGWIQHLISTFGTAANGGVPYYQLDNEPGGWSNTHRDVEPTQPDYDTIISLGQQMAAMIKQTDPSSQVFGPVDFTLGGWIGTPSKQNNLYAGQYYLQQMAAYDAANHQRILDYFDEHYYGGGSTDALELADTRSLWDPTYNSGTWVEQYYFDGPMMLLPRFRNWIQTYYPGTKLSISEYSFAMGTNPLVDMLTETDVLGIYGVQALDFANMWNVPQPTAPLAYSFRIFRNYDGAGSQFGDTSVNSTSTNQGQLSVYGALRSADGALTVVAINKTTSAIQTTLSLANFNANPSAAAYTYSNANLTAIVAASPAAVVSNGITYSFPAYSATVLVFTPASGTLGATSTTVAASSMQVTSGQSVTFTAMVAPQSGTGTPTGSVSFYDGTLLLSTVNLTSGAASLTTSTLTSGSNSITAKYSGDSNYASSTSTSAMVVVSASTKTATASSLTASATQLTTGQTLTLNASVAPTSGSGTPTGTFSFLDGATQIGTATVAAGAGAFSTSTLSAGTHTITVAYSGDTNFAASTSSAVTVVVSSPTKASTVTTLAASSTQVASGTSVMFTGQVSPATGTGTPTGTISFVDGGAQIGTATLAAGAGSFSTSTLAVGTHTITVAYSGDSNFAASTSATVTVVVSALTKIGTTDSLTASASQVTPGTSVTFSATVAAASGSGTPTGTLSFLDGGASIGSSTLASGAGSFSTTALAAGTHTITSAYSGDANYSASTSGAVSVTVAAANAGDYSLALNSAALTVAAGGSGKLTLTVTPETGFKQAVSFSCAGLPTGADCEFNPQSVAPAGTAVATMLTVVVPAASTTTGTIAPISIGSMPRNVAALYAFTFTFVGIFGVITIAQKRRTLPHRTQFAPAFLKCVAVAAMLVTASCAGYTNGGPTKTPPPNSTSTTYTVTVTATATNAPTHMQSFTLTVTQ